MKHRMPAAALLVLGSAVAFQGLTREGTNHRPLPSVPARVDRDPGADEAPHPRPDRVRPDPEDSARPLKSEGRPAGGGKGAPASSAKLMGWLSRALSLTEAQRDSIGRLLKERDREIQEYQDSVRANNVLIPSEYEWWAADRKAAWFLKIDGVLDGEQHRRWIALVSQGVLNEGLAFTVEPGMTVLE